MIFFDTECCGLHSPIVLVQYARDDGEILLHNPWYLPARETIILFEKFLQEPIVGFNLEFDWFHICQMYTTLIQFPDMDWIPIDHITDYALLEEKGRFGPCLKPMSVCDLMCFARKGPYQSTMGRKDIVIKKVPTPLAFVLADELDKKILIKDIYFSKKENPKKRWQVMDIHDEFGDIDANFKNVVLKFAPSSALKALAMDALGFEKDEILLFTDVDLPSKLYPLEFGYAPFATADIIDKKTGFILPVSPDNWRGKWPDVIRYHASHWEYNQTARQYAADDVKYTRGLYHFFKNPEFDDDDSILTCMVGASRWHGFAVDISAVRELRKEAVARAIKLRKLFNFNSSRACMLYMEQVMDETEKLALRHEGKRSTKSAILEKIAKWTLDEVCPACKGQGCKECDEGLKHTEIKHKAALRAEEILDARHAKKEVELYDKLIVARRLHAGYNVIGTLSSRMSGIGGLNPQGIKRAKRIRKCFTLADMPDYCLDGGDFEGFEVTITDAAYKDPVLHQDITELHTCFHCQGKGTNCLECKGIGKVTKKIHGIFGTFFFNKTYEEILATKGANEPMLDLYTRSKNGVFALFYMGEVHTLMNRINIAKEQAEAGFNRLLARYKVFAQERKRYMDMFCSMRQPGGIGSKVIWAEPHDYIESMLGFRRYFTLENQICKTLFQLGEKPPDSWKKIKINVIRRDRVQTACGALQSALFASAFALQAANMRAAGNHVIQSTGGQITKKLQRRIWELQPVGCHPWQVQPMNSHDEIQCPRLKTIETKSVVDSFIKEMKSVVPLLEMKWKEGVATWADK